MFKRWRSTRNARWEQHWRDHDAIQKHLTRVADVDAFAMAMAIGSALRDAQGTGSGVDTDTVREHLAEVDAR